MSTPRNLSHFRGYVAQRVNDKSFKLFHIVHCAECHRHLEAHSLVIFATEADLRANKIDVYHGPETERAMQPFRSHDWLCPYHYTLWFNPLKLRESYT